MEQEQRYFYTVEKEQEGLRLDQFLAAELSGQSRSYIQKLIKGGKVTLNEKAAKPGSRIQTEDRIVLTVPPLQELSVLPEEMDLDILYEDEDVILINKPKDMVVHPCPGRYSGTLVNLYVYLFTVRDISPASTACCGRGSCTALTKIPRECLSSVRRTSPIRVWQNS